MVLTGDINSLMSCYDRFSCKEQNASYWKISLSEVRKNDVKHCICETCKSPPFPSIP